MEHEHWTARRTGVEALGSVAASWPTRERLAQAQERLRIVNAEIGASRQRCFFRPLNDTALVVPTFLSLGRCIKLKGGGGVAKEKLLWRGGGGGWKVQVFLFALLE